MPTDQRLIEDYIPIEAISAEARREKSVRKGHISTLHLWWARRPLVAARAAVYGALVPAPADKKAASRPLRALLRGAGQGWPGSGPTHALDAGSGSRLWGICCLDRPLCRRNDRGRPDHLQPLRLGSGPGPHPQHRWKADQDPLPRQTLRGRDQHAPLERAERQRTCSAERDVRGRADGEGSRWRAGEGANASGPEQVSE